LIRYGFSQIFELFHPFKGTIVSLHTVTSSCIIISRYDHVLRFISFYFYSNVLTSKYKTSVIFVVVCMLLFYIQSDTKKRKLLKNPTKIEEIQEKKLLTEIEPLQLAF